MRANLQLLLLVLQICLTHSDEASCPQQCTCDSPVATCSRSGYKNIPLNIPHNITRLILTENHITTITKSQLENASQLTDLDLSDNGLHSIDSVQFKSLPNLTVLVLSNNKLASLQITVGLEDLRYLGIDGNMLNEVTIRSSLSMPNLVELDASNNNLQDLSFISNLKNMKKIHLNWNKVKTFSSDVLQNNTNLQYVALKDNTIDSINITHKLTSIRHLDLRGNCLTQIASTQFSNIPTLEILRLGGNKFNDTSINLTAGGLKSLRILNIQENGLTYFHSNNFTELHNLRYLGLWRNKIRDVYIGDGPENLTALALSANDIKTISVNTTSKQCMGHLRLLILTKNPLHCDCNLMNTLRQLPTTMVHGRCATPESMRGRYVSTLSQYLSTECKKALTNPIQIYCSSKNSESFGGHHSHANSYYFVTLSTQSTLVILLSLTLFYTIP